MPRSDRRGRSRETGGVVEPAAAPPSARFALTTIVFFCGASVLIIEVIGSRVLAPGYGTGLYTWSALISVTLAALAGGYFVGGRWADRAPHMTRLLGIVACAGVLTLALPWAAPSVLAFSSSLGLRGGVLVAAAILFVPPLFVLGCVSPFAIRIAAPATGDVGSAAGRLYALSTAGSLAGALGTGFVLVPNVGVKTILSLTGALLLAVAAVALLLEGRRRGAILAAALMTGGGSWAALLARVPIETPGFTVTARVPSFYGTLRVLETDESRILVVNGIGQTYVSKEPGGRASPYVEYLAAIPEMREPKESPRRVLLIGLGAGDVVRLLEPLGLHLDVVEIDPEIVDTTREKFGVTIAPERLFVEDGRVFLTRGTSLYDEILLDAYVGDDVPHHLFTKEAFAVTKKRLAKGGLLAVNCTSFIEPGADVAALAATLLSVFPHVVTMTYPGGGGLASYELLASDSPIALDPERVSAPDRRMTARAFTEISLAAGTVLTDDFSPLDRYRAPIGAAWRKSLAGLYGTRWALSDF